MKVTIGIPTYNRGYILLQTLESVLMVDYGNTEIIVADQTAEYEPQVQRRLFDMEKNGIIQLIKLERASLTYARNSILKKANGEIVLFLDDDVIVPKDLIHKHVKAYNDIRIKAVAGQVIHSKNWEVPAKPDEPETILWYQFKPEYSKRYVKEFPGGHHSIRKEFAIRCGGYDENFIGSANWEDSDMAKCITSNGGTIVYEPSAYIIHLRAPTGGCRIPGNKTWPEWTKSANLLLFAIRYWDYKDRRIWLCLKGSLRSGPFRIKENVVRFWRLPYAICSWFIGLSYAFRNAKNRKNTYAEKTHQEIL